MQDRFDDDEYRDGINLREGFVALTPLAMIEVRGGFINQEYWDQSLFISRRRAFPGLQEIVRGEFAGVKAELSAQQVVPTSYSVDDQREDKESLPTLQIQALKVSGSAFKAVEWKAMAGHFAWTNPPDKVAFESAQWERQCRR